MKFLGQNYQTLESEQDRQTETYTDALLLLAAFAHHESKLSLLSP